MMVSLKSAIILLLFLAKVLCLEPFAASGQIQHRNGEFSREYFDSIRSLVNDTTREHFIINAYRLAPGEEITIDGHLDEAAWRRAERAVGFVEKEPFPLIPMRDETEFAILYDDENLYIGVWCYDSEPGRIVRQLTPRGRNGPDNVSLFLDTYHDHRTGYKFVVSPTGVQADELRYDDVKRDSNWNGIWYSAGSVDEEGWYAEIRIPFFNLRYPNKPEHTWGFNILRFISKNASSGQWKPHMPEWDITTRMSQLGHIENISGISSGRTFEFRPYGIAGSTETAAIGQSATISTGGDIRYSPTPNLTADFTLNPDFAQVDADVFEINLTRFPTRFKELRPFFTERTNIFNTPMELFYSRRIGARGDILGGAKVTAKLDRGTELGMLGNITGNSFFTSHTQNPEKAAYGVFRVKKDILGSSSIGILAATKEEKDNFNRVAGLDGNFMITDHNLVNFQVATGQNELSGDRNMAWHLLYTRTGDKFGGEVTIDRVGPGFEINRVGYIRKEPDRGWNISSGLFRFSPRINNYNIRRITLNLKAQHTTDIFTTRYIDRWLARYPGFIPSEKFGTVITDEDGTRQVAGGIRHTGNRSLGGDITVNLLNEMVISGEYWHFTETELTGGYAGNLIELSYSTRPVRFGSRFAGKFAAGGGTFYNFDQKYPGTLRNLSLESEGRISYNIITVLEGGFTDTFDNTGRHDGRYYKLSANTIWMFTKDFFFRVHAQGIFGTTYYGQRETNNEYLLSCLLSWEYRPGSFLYLAYNEGRFDESNPTRSRYMEFNDRTFVLKLSYFFSI